MTARTGCTVAIAMATTCSSVSPRMCAVGRPSASRRSANYQPKSWNYDAVKSFKADFNDEVHISHHKKLKDGVRQLLLCKNPQASAKLQLVDMLRRLGLAYQFEEEIHHVLASFTKSTAAAFDLENDILSAATLFRLLRESGHTVSPDLLIASMDSMNKLKERKENDIEALLSLYEASHVSFRGEQVLDEVRIFASKSLQNLMPAMDPNLKRKVAHAFALPLHWRAPRFEALWALEQYSELEGNNSTISSVLQLAKLDFNIVQAIHQKELASLTRWCMDFKFSEKLSFARDRFIESYYFAVGLTFEPQFGGCREIVTKIATLIVYLDDVYDVFGTLDELTLFTDAIGRWDYSAMKGLPEYMQAMYDAILHTSNEISDRVFKEQGYDPLPFLRKAWHDLCKAFLLEAIWHYGNHSPALTEYLSNGWISSTGPLILLHAFTMLKQKITAESLHQLQSYPRLVHLSSMIFRLCNDSATHSAELERGDAPSAIACYMRENGVNEQDAREAMNGVIRETWKEINEEAFRRDPQGALPKSFAAICMNLARTTHCIYQSGDSFSAPDEENNMQVEKLLFRSTVLQPMRI